MRCKLLVVLICAAMLSGCNDRLTTVARSIELGQTNELFTYLQNGGHPNVSLPSRRPRDREPSLLHLAASSGNITALQLLIDRGADINAQDKRRRTPLMDVLNADPREGHSECFDQLLQKGANVDLQDSQGMTVLMFACRYNLNDYAERLLREGMDLNRTNVNGFTALHYVCSVPLAQKMIQMGASPSVKNVNGATPAEVANRMGRPRIAEAIEDAERRSKDP